MPFIRQAMTFNGDINRIEQQTLGPEPPNPYNLPFRHLALAEALYEKNQIMPTRGQLDKVWECAGSNHQQPGLSIPALWLTLLCDQAEGRQKETHFMAEEIYYRSLQTSIPIWRRIGQAVRTYILLQEGHIEDAADWLSEQKEILPIYWHQWTSFEFFMFARALILFQETEEANNLLRRMLTSASLEENSGVHLERRILQTIATIQLGRHEESRLYIRSALEIGWKNGYKRLFLDHDPLVFLSINEVQDELPDYLQRYCSQLLQLGRNEDLKVISENPKMKDALTIREIQILQCIRQGFSNRTIGEQLHISEGTVKGHLHRIFKKLNVKNRVQAVKAAENDRMI
ncbi:helix-turn-helix transcriptional regulator [Halalkalibacter oceani]|uniref:helix-turn-helix transcriptional regulator n=1 Tax=Halalkalibacter oceani TaxID=1653776 RepID=UPI00203E44D0|nr:helix-turn-helix transcriptional regulator [Halalkalibacter oceani]MCM3762022.1 LuxR C-terminal-related transcriptional regulator [Halalkalibacter oceani]